MRYLVGVDIGGTFTDFVVYDTKESRFLSDKVLTTPERPANGVLQGLDQLAEKQGVDPDKIDKILHATTLATNALIERKGSLTGLITTAGFEYLLDIRKGLRYNQYDLQPAGSRPLRSKISQTRHLRAHTRLWQHLEGAR